MIKKTITYEDFNGEKHTEEFHFHLTEAELVEVEAYAGGDLEQQLLLMLATNDSAKIMDTFKHILLKSYGVKSPDGKAFIKNKEVRESFEYSNAYSEIFMEILSDEDKSVQFINGIMPASIKAKAVKAQKTKSGDEKAEVE